MAERGRLGCYQETQQERSGFGKTGVHIPQPPTGSAVSSDARALQSCSVNGSCRYAPGLSFGKNKNDLPASCGPGPVWQACLLAHPFAESFSAWPCSHRGDRDRPDPVPRKMRKTDSSGAFAVALRAARLAARCQCHLPTQNTFRPLRGSGSQTPPSYTSRSKCRMSGGRTSSPPHRVPHGPVTCKLQGKLYPPPPPQLHPHALLPSTMLGRGGKATAMLPCGKEEGKHSDVHSNRPIVLASTGWTCSGWLVRPTWFWKILLSPPSL